MLRPQSKTILLSDLLIHPFEKHVFYRIIYYLLYNEKIILDLKDCSLRPSLADEIFGRLAAELGANKFKKSIKIINASDTNMVLIKHVVGRRVSEKVKLEIKKMEDFIENEDVEKIKKEGNRFLRLLKKLLIDSIRNFLKWIFNKINLMFK